MAWFFGVIGQVIDRLSRLAFLDWVGVVIVFLLYGIAKILGQCNDHLYDIESHLGKMAPSDSVADPLDNLTPDFELPKGSEGSAR